MDWSKAKNILIAALLITNLMLGLAIYNNTNGSRHEQSDLRNNAVRLLEMHGIYVEEELIPERTERLPVMSVRYRTLSQETISAATAGASRLAETATEEDYHRSAKSILEEVGIPDDICTFESVTSQGAVTEVIFGMEYEGYALDNAKIRVTFQDGWPAEVSDSWVEPLDMGQNRKRVLPAHEALIRFMTALESQEERGEIRVDQVRLVYWLEGYTEHTGVSEDTAVPYWQIGYNDGNSEYIPAYE